MSTFISYSHESDRHAEKVRGLAEKLRRGGVDAVLDVYDPHPAQGWAKWMEEQLSKSDFVLIVLSPRYIADFTRARDAASGARFEGSLISSLLLAKGVDYSWLAVICFNDWATAEIPPILAACTRYNVEQEDEYTKLYAFLTGQPLIERPPLGQVIPLRARRSALPISTSFEEMCARIKPLMKENARIFFDFGPNSGAAPEQKIVRYDLSLWKRNRANIASNNEQIRQIISSGKELIPGAYAVLFERWLSHIDAFAAHLEDDCIDYSEHQFPRDVVPVVEENA
jgi:hypothetical protein